MDDNTQIVLIVIALIVAAVALVVTGHGVVVFWLAIGLWVFFS